MSVTKRPNIVLFVPDSYRGDVLGHQNNAAALTPNLDALVASDAVSYGNAFAQNPVCTPSRCSFMTGWYPHVHGHRSMHNMLKEHEPSLLTVLQREGYYIWYASVRPRTISATAMKSFHLQESTPSIWSTSSHLPFHQMILAMVRSIAGFTPVMATVLSIGIMIRLVSWVQST